MTKLSLIEESIRKGVAKFSQEGALLVETGKFTGRAASKRYITKRPEVEKTINWAGNKSIDLETKTRLLKGIKDKHSNTKTYNYKGFVGGFEVEVESTSPWHIIFANNMFREKAIAELRELCKEWGTIKIYHDPYGTTSEHGL